MRTEHTLRYLLLRHLKSFEGKVAKSTFLEVTRSLGVRPEGDSYIVTWRVGGEPRERVFPRQAFAFYRRGDVRPEGRGLEENLDNENSRIARAFGEEVFGVAAPLADRDGRESVEPHWAFEVAAALLFVVALRGVGGVDSLTATALLVLQLVEYPRRGRLYAAGAFVAVALVGPPAAGLLGASAYGLAQLVGPDALQRRLGLVLCLVAAGLGGARLLGTEAAPTFGLAVPLVVLLGVGIAVGRSLFASHFRALPLALPFYCCGLYADGFGTAAFVGLGVLLLSTLWTAYGHRWIPVQRQRTLTPNG